MLCAIIILFNSCLLQVRAFANSFVRTEPRNSERQPGFLGTPGCGSSVFCRLSVRTISGERYSPLLASCIQLIPII